MSLIKVDCSFLWCAYSRYYPLFGLMANVALIFSGQYVKYVSSLRSGLPIGN